MVNSELNIFGHYAAFKLLVLLDIMRNNKFILSDLVRLNNVATLLAKSISNDITTFTSGVFYQNDNQELILQNKDTIKNDIIDCINNYGFNYEILKNDFLYNFDKSKPPKFYKITDYKYVPLILMEYTQNENFVQDIKLTINDLSLFFDCSYSSNELLYFEVIVDISNLIDSITKHKKFKKENTIKYSKIQEKLYNYLKKWVKEYNSYGIEYVAFHNYIKRYTKYIDKAIYDLNKKYMVINNTNEKLVEYKKDIDQYTINKAIIQL